jgi:hypothetical protein
MTTLDHVEGISVPGDVFAKPANEYLALICLWNGMEFLYRHARQCDEVARMRVNPDGNVQFVGSGSVPIFDGIPRALLTCSFHWYAISACQYVRLVGAIAYKQDSSRPLPKAYAETIIPEVVAFRDKVAAHFAWGTENKRDNDAERLASVIPPLNFCSDTWEVGTYKVTLSGKKTYSSEAIQPWSLCRVHERLRDRYWPGNQGTNESA